MKKILLTLLCLTLVSSCRFRSNLSKPSIEPCYNRGANIVGFLDGADRQSETDEQRREILKTLHDLLSLCPKELLARRYANYAAEPDKWTAVELLHSYFVPVNPCMEDGIQTFYILKHTEELYQNSSNPDARKIIKQHIKMIKKAIGEEKSDGP